MLVLEPWQWIAALLLDLALGDPRNWPHVAKWAGSLSVWYEERITARLGRSIRSGILFLIVMVVTMVGGFMIVWKILSMIHPLLASFWGVLAVYQSIAPRDLHQHAMAVFYRLRQGEIVDARQRLSWIVGRDTKDLSEAEVTRATIESVGESACDGVLAPMLWALCAGPVGAVFYRTVNTLDSMVGHRDERYELFGKASALLDDVLNYIPARFLGAVSLFWHRSATMNELSMEASHHASPNAGWGEAALAMFLGVRLGGTNYYDGVAVESPQFNEEGRPPVLGDIPASVAWMWRMMVSIALLGTLVLLLKS